MTDSEFKTQYAVHLDPQQEVAIQAVEGPVLLLAVPGSGKTTVSVKCSGGLKVIRENERIPPYRT